LFAWKIRQGLKHGVDAERIKAYVQQFWNENMSVHFKQEEQILFAPIPDDKVQRAVREHQEIKTKIEQVLAATTTEVAAKLNGLADAVDAHVRYEERDLFPHLEKSLSTQQLEEIGKTLEKEPILKDDFQDEFWIRPK
jgi:iron-sulfur cluster repair protein YtfE (RIC family)